MWICSGGAVEGRFAVAMAEGGGVSGEEEREKGGRYRRNVVVVACFGYVQGFLTTPVPRLIDFGEL